MCHTSNLVHMKVTIKMRPLALGNYYESSIYELSFSRNFKLQQGIPNFKEHMMLDRNKSNKESKDKLKNQHLGSLGINT